MKFFTFVLLTISVCHLISPTVAFNAIYGRINRKIRMACKPDFNRMKGFTACSNCKHVTGMTGELIGTAYKMFAVAKPAVCGNDHFIDEKVKFPCHCDPDKTVDPNLNALGIGRW